jgi:hypothetical protein
MAMTRKLLVVATLAWVAPLSAHQAPAVARHHPASCPYARARAAAVQRAVATPAIAQASAPSMIVVQATPGTAAVLGLRPSAAFMP